MNTLLCIDDDQDILNALEVLLKNENYNILTATDGIKALQLIASHDIAVVLCDYHMPGMNGVELLSLIKEKLPNTVRLLLTGDRDKDLTVDVINKGAVFKFSHKPWNSNELVLMLREAFNLYNLTCENECLTKQLKEANENLSETNKILEDRVEEKVAEITKLTFYDEITGLPNKAFLTEWLSHAIKQTDRTAQKIGVLILDIDRFKKVNESLGHTSGDQLLKIIGRRISHYTREADALCRISGDMFCIVINGYESTDDTPDIAERLLREIEKPLVVDNEDVYLTASIGLCIFPDDGITADMLLRNAESALNYSKEKGGNTYHYYKEEFNLRAKTRLSLEAELHQAIRKNEFILYYQPRVCSNQLKIVGAEALLRWQHPRRGLVPPNDFIPILEETGLIIPVGEWVIIEVCKTIKRLQDYGFSNLKVSANLSPLQFKHNDLIAQIHNIAADKLYASSLQSLEMEITENVLVNDIDRAKSVLQVLHDEGITFAIDDFGTGYSSLSYLIQLPFDMIKIDISFISQMGINPDAEAVVRAIIMLAQSLRLKSIAEGVETEAQSQALRVLGCDEFQGFLYGKPVPEEQFIASLKGEKTASEQVNLNDKTDSEQTKSRLTKLATI